MALLIPVGFAHAVYEFRLTDDPEPIVTTMGHDLTGVSGGDYTEVANRLFNAFFDSFETTINNAYALTGVSLYVGQDGGPPAVFESTEAEAPFTLTGNALPQNCAVLMRKRTSLAGRRGRGRCYIPGILEASVDSKGLIAPASVDAWQASADQWMDWLDGTEPGSVAYPPVVLHRSEGIGEEPPPTPVLLFQIDEILATQRQRLRR